MANARCLLVLYVITGTTCLARIDFQNLGAVVTDCLATGFSLLMVSDVALTNASPFPADQTTLTFTITNPEPATSTINVNDIYWTIGLTTALNHNETFTTPLAIVNGTPVTIMGTPQTLNQAYNTGAFSYQILIYSNGANTYASPIACWIAAVNFTAPPNPSDLFPGTSQLSVSQLSLYPTVPKYNELFNLIFEVECTTTSITTFNLILWTVTFNSAIDIFSRVNLITPLTLANGSTCDMTSNSVNLTQNLTTISWYQYELRFYTNVTQIAHWKGYQIVQPTPPSPPGCYNGNSQLSVQKVVLHPSSPQIYDSISLTFEVENNSGEDVTFKDIFSILTFNPNSPITDNLVLQDLTLPAGQYIGLAGNKVTLNESVSSGAYPYKFVFYSNSTAEIACWIGIVTVAPSSSSYIYFLAWLSVLFMS